MAAAFRTDVDSSDMDDALCRISWSDDEAAADDPDDSDDVDDDGVRNDMDEALGLTGSAGGGGGPGCWWVGEPIPLSSSRLSTASSAVVECLGCCGCCQALLATKVLVFRGRG